MLHGKTAPALQDITPRGNRTSLTRVGSWRVIAAQHSSSNACQSRSRDPRLDLISSQASRAISPPMLQTDSSRSQRIVIRFTLRYFVQRCRKQRDGMSQNNRTNSSSRDFRSLSLFFCLFRIYFHPLSFSLFLHRVVSFLPLSRMLSFVVTSSLFVSMFIHSISCLLFFLLLSIRSYRHFFSLSLIFFFLLSSHYYPLFSFFGFSSYVPFSLLPVLFILFFTLSLC